TIARSSPSGSAACNACSSFSSIVIRIASLVIVTKTLSCTLDTFEPFQMQGLRQVDGQRCIQPEGIFHSPFLGNDWLPNRVRAALLGYLPRRMSACRSNNCSSELNPKMRAVTSPITVSGSILTPESEK